MTQPTDALPALPAGMTYLKLAIPMTTEVAEEIDEVAVREAAIQAVEQAVRYDVALRRRTA